MEVEERRKGVSVGEENSYQKTSRVKGIREAPEHLKLRTSRSSRLSGSTWAHLSPILVTMIFPDALKITLSSSNALVHQFIQ